MSNIALNMVSALHGGGFKTYNDNLLNELLKEKNNNSKYFVFVNKSDFLIKEKKENLNIIYVSNFFSKSILRIIWMQTVLPFYLKFYKINVFFSPMNILPVILKFSKIKKVLVLHSNLPWLFPEDLPGNKIKILLQKFLTSISVKISDRLIVDSFNAKEEIENIFLNISNKISVIYLGVDFSFFNKKQNSTDRTIKVNKPFLLTISSSVKYHCIIELIEAYEKTCKAFESIPDYLILSKCLDNNYYEKINKRIKTSKYKNKITLIENISKDKIPWLYKNSYAYIFSSYCEVFGLTNLEAMYCKIPVLTSNKSSIPEICRDGALYFEPKDTEDIKNNILKICKDKNLKNSLIKKGYSRSLSFSWEKTFKKTMKVIRDI